MICATSRESARRTLLVGAGALTMAAWFAGPAKAGDSPRVEFKTSAGAFVIEVYPDKAPKTVENFLHYVADGHYSGTLFHRVIPNFMVQGGGFDSDYKQKKTRAPVAHEGRAALAAGGAKNVVGTVAMARTADPDSATSQFFINVANNAFLDPVVIPPGDPVPRFEYQGRTYENTPRAKLESAPQLYGYTVFGKVVSGMDVIEKIKATPTGAGGPFPTDAPKTPVVIESAVVVK